MPSHGLPDAQNFFCVSAYDFAIASRDRRLWLPELDTPDLFPGHALFSEAGGGAIFDQHNVAKAVHRYALWRVWDPENRPLMMIGAEVRFAPRSVVARPSSG